MGIFSLEEDNVKFEEELNTFSHLLEGCDDNTSTCVVHRAADIRHSSGKRINFKPFIEEIQELNKG